MSKLSHDDMWDVLGPQDFDYILDAVSLMAQAQGDLLHLRKCVDDLNAMISIDDGLSIRDNAEIYSIVDDVNNIINELSSKSSIIKGI